MLNFAAACHLWPLAAKASRLSFTNNLVDEATADEEFPGFHDNAGLLLLFFQGYNDFIGLGGASSRPGNVQICHRV